MGKAKQPPGTFPVAAQLHAAVGASASYVCLTWVCFLRSRREVGDTVGTVNLKLVKHVARKLEVPDKPRHGRHLKWDKYGSWSLRGK